MNKKPVKYLVYIIIALFFLFYAQMRYENSLLPIPRSGFGDVGEYYKIASQSIFSQSFWIGERPPTIPLFFKLTGTEYGQNYDKVVTFQLLFSIVSWGVLALTLAKITKNTIMKPISFAIILAFSLSEEIIMWDYLIISESVSISLMVLFIASSILLLEKWNALRISFLVVISILLVGARENFAYWLLMIGFSLLILLLVKKHIKRVLVISVFFILLFLISDSLASASLRWYFPLLNTISIRILPHEEHTAYLEKLGMPVTDALLERRGLALHQGNPTMIEDPELEPFREWIKSEGKQAYIKFLWFYKAELLQDWTQEIETVLVPDFYFYGASKFTPIIKNLRLDEYLYPIRFGIFLFFAANFMASAGTVWAFYERKINWVAPLLLILLSFPQLLFILSADGNDLARHCLFYSVQLRLGVWIFILYSLDFLISQIKTTNFYLASKATIFSFRKPAKN